VRELSCINIRGGGRETDPHGVPTAPDGGRNDPVAATINRILIALVRDAAEADRVPGVLLSAVGTAAGTDAAVAVRDVSTVACGEGTINREFCLDLAVRRRRSDLSHQALGTTSHRPQPAAERQPANHRLGRNSRLGDARRTHYPEPA